MKEDIIKKFIKEQQRTAKRHKPNRLQVAHKSLCTSFAMSLHFTTNCKGNNKIYNRLNFKDNEKNGPAHSPFGKRKY